MKMCSRKVRRRFIQETNGMANWKIFFVFVKFARERGVNECNGRVYPGLWPEKISCLARFDSYKEREGINAFVSKGVSTYCHLTCIATRMDKVWSNKGKG